MVLLLKLSRRDCMSLECAGREWRSDSRSTHVIVTLLLYYLFRWFILPSSSGEAPGGHICLWSGRTHHPSDCCCCLVVQLCPTLRVPMDQSTPGPPVFHCLLEFGQIHVGRFGDIVQQSCPLSSPSPLAFTLSQHQGLFLESSLLMRWPKYWSLSFRICPSNEHSGLIAFRMDRFVLLTVQGTLKGLLQHQNHQFFSGQPSL